MNDFNSLVAKAVRKNCMFRKTEKKYGFGSPEDGPIVPFLDTVMTALEAGMKKNDWGIVAEAYVMVRDRHLLLNG